MSERGTRAAIPDTSCLIALKSLRLLDLLPRFYEEVVVPRAVEEEFGEALPSWAKVATAVNRPLIRALRSSLGPGEAEVIALVAERDGGVAILDDLRARKTACGLGLRVTGTIAILLKAKTEGMLASLADALAELEETTFHISDELKARALDLAGERNRNPG